MSQEDKLKKIIEKAIENGWNERVVLFRDFKPSEYWLEDGWKMYLFNQSFAKSIWGERKLMPSGEDMDNAWKVHLRQAVISDNPIDYYYENL